MKKRTYKIYIECGNCLSTATVKIPKGTRAEGYKGVCHKCECPITIGKVSEEED